MSQPFLKKLRRGLGLAWLAAALCLALAAACLGALALVGGDALLVFPQALRGRWPWLLLAACVPALAWAVRRFKTLPDPRLARFLEGRIPSLGTRLTNAVDLARSPGGSAVRSELVRRSVALGAHAAGGLRAWPLARRPFARGLAFACGALALFLLCRLALPGVFNAVLPRFLDPRGDHPPYSRIAFEVTPGNLTLSYGQAVTVQARLSGPAEGSPELVAESEKGQTRLPMFHAPDGGFFQTLNGVEEDTLFYVSLGKARSRRHKISVQKTPRIREVEAAYEFPEYTGLAGKRLKLKDEAQEAPAGTRVTLSAASNRPLSGGLLTLTALGGGAALTRSMSRGPEDFLASASFILTQPVAFSIRVTDEAGTPSERDFRGRINVLHDQKPRIFVLAPEKRSIATPESALDLKVQASDDYGVGQILCFRGINGSIERPAAMALDGAPGDIRMEASGRLDMANLGVRPGDVIELYFEALDLKPRDVNIASTDLYTIDIVSREEFEELARMRRISQDLFALYDLLGSRLARLEKRAAELSARAEAGENPPSKEEMDGLIRDLKSYADTLARHIEAPPRLDIEISFKKTLAREREAVLSLAEKAAAQDPAEAARTCAAELGRMMGVIRQQVAEPLDEIRMVMAVHREMERFKSLARQQHELTRFAARFAKQATLSDLDRAELTQMAQTEASINSELASIIETLRKTAKEMRGDPPYLELHNRIVGFLNALHELAIPNEIEEAAAALGALDGPAGYPPAKSARDNMEKLLSQCRNAQNEGLAGLAASLGSGLDQGNTIQQLRAAMGAGNMRSQSGYSMTGARDLGMYGPGGAGEMSDLLSRDPQASPAGMGARAGATLDGGPQDKGPEAQGRVQLRPDLRFPLRYQEMVGDYFKAVSEMATKYY